jgi:hypothetical protein
VNGNLWGTAFPCGYRESAIGFLKVTFDLVGSILPLKVRLHHRRNDRPIARDSQIVLFW